MNGEKDDFYTMKLRRDRLRLLNEIIEWWKKYKPLPLSGEPMKEDTEEMPSCLTCGRPYDEPQGICQDCGGEAEIFARSFTDPGLIVELCGHCSKIFLDYGTWEIIGHE